jgi:predicted DNA-binding ribbon-helix-helix protein
MAHVAAGAFGFLIFNQAFEGPDLYGESSFFETRPSKWHRITVRSYENRLYSKGGTMKSQAIKRSIRVDGHKTSITLEDAFWSGLKEIAQAQGATVAQTVTEIDKTRQRSNLSSAVRLFVLDWVRSQKVGATVGETAAPKSAASFGG